MPAGPAVWGPAGYRLGQDQAEWNRRAQEAYGKYGALLRRTDAITDQAARDEIKAWLGRNDVPGAPAERYKAVSDAIEAGAGWNALSQKRVADLEDTVRDFEAKVKDAESRYGNLNSEKAPVPTAIPGGGLTPTGFALGVVAVLALIVVPLVIE